jgi:gliding motility-associated-like protein
VPPSFYVPTGFSPNNDGKNDILKPILLGMKSLNYFRVFDRWGRLLFYTTQKGAGWDGTYKGNPQDPGTYVWMASGATFTGEVIVRKGYAVLLR